MTDLPALIERLEAGNWSDRDRARIDGLIWRAVAAPLPDGYRWAEVHGEWCQIGPWGVSDLECAPHFTTDLSAALTLYPAGRVPALIPSNPRACAADALRARMNERKE